MNPIAVTDNLALYETDEAEGVGFVEDISSGSKTEEKKIVSLLSLASDWKPYIPKEVDGLGKQAPPGPPPREGLKWKPSTHRWIRPKEDEWDKEEEDAWASNMEQLVFSDMMSEQSPGKIFKALGIKLQHNKDTSLSYKTDAASITERLRFPKGRFPINRSLQLIEKIPLKIARQVKSRSSQTGHMRLEIGNGTITDFRQNQHLRDVRPRGWPIDSTWDDVAGADGISGVTIGTHGLGYKNMVLHEIGHAVDESYVSSEFSKLSKHPEYRKLYKALDKEKINPYYYQREAGDDAGPSELFASLFASALNKIPYDDDTVNESMYQPILKWMKSLIKSLS